MGYPFRAEYIIDQGYYNNSIVFRAKNFRIFRRSREEKLPDRKRDDRDHARIGKKAMMFLGDHWIGTEPFMEEFKTLGIDAVVEA